ncbi:disease resistance protein RUN1-like, partial [Hibiscus syriacus]|uniref:disease resistance protein RUN1-like n=1 Tax=Hibiscus syriacus TaxID=106335 RepID=UPI0019204DC3
MASSSSSSSRLTKHQVFLSFRGEDTRLNFTAHLLQALEHKGISVFFDEKKLERGEQLSQALSNAIAASYISLIVLSEDYASSKSCLAELCDIMDGKHNKKHAVLPIFYHVNPSHVRHLGGTFKTSFEKHESEGLKQVEQWKKAFTEVGKLKGWHIAFDRYLLFARPETEYIKEIIDDVTKKLRSSLPSPSVCDQLIGTDYQKNLVLGLIQKEESRVIGLWGPGGIGKTTLADVVFHENSSKFEDRYFLQNIRESAEKQGMKSIRDELLSKLLNENDLRISTPSIGSPYRERLNSKMVLVVLDDVSHANQIDFLGIRHFGHGSKIILTSRDRRVLYNGGAKEIYEVKKLDEDHSMQLFSTFAFKQLNPDGDFEDLSNKFMEYSKGNPLALKVLGSQLYKKSKQDWESELHKLKEYGQPEILQILRSSFEGLGKPERDIFLDIACFFKGESKEDIENVLSCEYEGAVCGINKLLDKCLLDIRPFKKSFMNTLLAIEPCEKISMHDMLEEMGKNIVCQESKDPGNRSRLWNFKDVNQVFRYNE